MMLKSISNRVSAHQAGKPRAQTPSLSAPQRVVVAPAAAREPNNGSGSEPHWFARAGAVLASGVLSASLMFPGVFVLMCGCVESFTEWCVCGGAFCMPLHAACCGAF